MPYANNNGVKIYYEVEGQGPPLMLMHGMGSSLEGWRVNGYAQELSKDHRLILVDARCFGKSDKPLLLQNSRRKAWNYLKQQGISPLSG